MFLCIKKSDLHSLADDNTITATCSTLREILKTLEQQSESVASYFKQNQIIVNADKFQSIVLNKKESEVKYKLTIDNNDIAATKSVKLLGITIYDRLQLVVYFNIHHQKFVSNLSNCNCK